VLYQIFRFERPKDWCLNKALLVRKPGQPRLRAFLNKFCLEVDILQGANLGKMRRSTAPENLSTRAAFIGPAEEHLC
jgi:hypothetical protein